LVRFYKDRIKTGDSCEFGEVFISKKASGLRLPFGYYVLEFGEYWVVARFPFYR
jgi:hypothetical protein